MHYRSNGEPSAIESDDPEAFLRTPGVADETWQSRTCSQVALKNRSLSIQSEVLTTEFGTQHTVWKGRITIKEKESINVR